MHIDSTTNCELKKPCIDLSMGIFQLVYGIKQINYVGDISQKVFLPAAKLAAGQEMV